MEGKEFINFKSDKKPNIPNYGVKGKLSGAVIFTLILGLIFFMYNPILNLRFSSGLLNIFLIVGIYALILLDSKKLGTIIIIAGFIIQPVVLIYSSPIFHAGQYHQLLGDVKESDYEDNIPNIENTKIPVVDKELAKKLGDKVLGNDLGLGSQFTVGEYYFVSTADDLAWVAPLEPQSFFKWFQNREGAPGYVYVSATNPNDVRLVKNVDGKDIHIKYTNNAYFMDEIKRHTYFSGNMTKGMTDYSFEIDDQGNPYWVISAYKPTIGFLGNDTSGVIVVNAQTGDTKFYKDINKAPKWVERIQPEQIINDQITDWGAYRNGWLNTIFAQKEMIKPTEGHSYVYIDNKPYYYTGLTSIKSDESTVGFMLVNLTTKDANFYKITGATETAARKSAQGQVQQFEYEATFPLLLNEYGTPTYFMTLKDQDGLIKQYAYVSVKNYNIVGVGSSKASALKSYQSSLKDSNMIKASDIPQTKVTGVLDRINLVDGNYYITIKGSNDIYKVASDLSKSLVVTQAGDKVTVEFMKVENDYNEVSKFTNNTLEK